MVLLIAVVMVVGSSRSEKAEAHIEPYEIWYIDCEPEPLDPPDHQTTNSKPEQQLVIEPEPVKEEKIYFDTALSHEMQDFIEEVCEEYRIAPSLIIAMIERESDCNPSAIGDSGRSFGLMQVQERWHRDRMERLECTDLLDPEQNVMVGVDFVHELSQKNQDVYWVLMAYNGGKAYADKYYSAGIISEYASEVVERSTELEEGRDSNENMQYAADKDVD